MRILLDENIPRPVRGILTGHDVRTVPEMGWAGYSNGRLLNAAETAGFEAIITSDQNFVAQHNLAGRTIAIVLLSTNIWPAIRTQPQTLQRALGNVAPGTITHATFRRSRRPRPPSAPTC